MALGKRRRLDRSIRAKGVAPEPESREREQGSTSGPYDITDAPDDEMVRIDLGALRVPTPRGGDLRLDVNKAGAIVSATVRLKGSAMQIGVFAAPRHEGIWADVRSEIKDTLSKQGGTGTEDKGEFGTELHAQLAMKQGPAPARFVGVDGPRWFLRALVTGPAAADEAAAEPLLEVFRNLVVVRGTEPMPVRDPIPLRLPTDATPTAVADGGSVDGTDTSDDSGTAAD